MKDEDSGNSLISVILPTYREGKNLREMVTRIFRSLDDNALEGECIIIDDDSGDDTESICKELAKIYKLRLIIRKGERGLSTAVVRGMREARGEIFVVMDADGQHEPEEIPNFVKSVKENDVIFGYRVQKQKMPFERRLANTAIDIAIRSLFNINVKDTQSGFRAFTRDAYKKLRWESSDYCVETEMIANTGKHKLKYGQIPISTIYVDKYKGAGVSDAFKITINLLKWRLVK